MCGGYQSFAFKIMFLLVFSFLALSVDSQAVINYQLSKFHPASFLPNINLCANSTSANTFVVRSKAQCVQACQHGGDISTCVGVNFRQLSNLCEVYDQCPTNYTINTSGCLHLQKVNKTGRKACQISVACDKNCISGCSEQGPGKCDSSCKAKFALASNFTCQPCDANCNGDCVLRGPGKCDSLCITNTGLRPDFTCQPCNSLYCDSTCSVNGPGTCDGPCKTGSNLDATTHKCSAPCPPAWLYVPDTGHCYLYRSSFGERASAAAFCETSGGYLAWIETDQERIALASALGSEVVSTTWIGGCRILHFGFNLNFCWTQLCASGTGGAGGIAIGPNMWQSNEPNNVGYYASDVTTGEWCVAIGDPIDFRLRDQDCEGFAPALCEYGSP